MNLRPNNFIFTSRFDPGDETNGINSPHSDKSGSQNSTNGNVFLRPPSPSHRNPHSPYPLAGIFPFGRRPLPRLRLSLPLLCTKSSSLLDVFLGNLSHDGANNVPSIYLTYLKNYHHMDKRHQKS